MIPEFNLDSAQKIWLKEAWRRLRETGSVPDYQTLRRATLSATGADFSPATISKWLVREKATEITFLGVMHAEPGSSILKDAESILLLIKKKLWDADNNGEFVLSDLAAELGLEPVYAQTIFGMVAEYGNAFDSASSKVQIPNTKFHYDLITIKDGSTFDAYIRFNSLEEKMAEYYARIKEFEPDIPKKSGREIGNASLWLDSNGQLHQSTSKFGYFNLQSNHFINPKRIKELVELKSDFDFLKLLHLCKEINFNYMHGNFYAVALLTRALIDHVPPVFKCENFNQVTNEYKAEHNAKSFSASMKHLHKSLRNIGDSLIHSMIRKSEVAPNETQIDFKNDVDVLLAEIVRTLR